MIVRKPRTGSSTNPPAITPGIERVREMVVLGVTLTDTLSFRQHVDRIVARTAQTSYALRLLRSHGLGAPQLFDVARATLVAQLTYASPALAGFINCEDKARLQSVLNPYTPKGGLQQPPCSFSPGSFSRIFFTERLQIADPTYLRHFLAHLSFGFPCTPPSGGTKIEGS